MKRLIILFFVFLLVGGVKLTLLASTSDYPDTVFISIEDFPIPALDSLKDKTFRDVTVTQNGKIAILARWSGIIERKDIVYIGRIKSGSFEVEKSITVTSGMFGVPKYKLEFFNGDLYLSGKSLDAYVFKYSDKGLRKEIIVSGGYIDFLESKYGKLWVVARDENGREALWYKEDEDNDWKSLQMPENYNISDITFDHYGNPWLIIKTDTDVYGKAKVFELKNDSLIDRDYNLGITIPWATQHDKIIVDKHNHPVLISTLNYRGICYSILNRQENNWYFYSLPETNFETEDFQGLRSAIADSLNNLFVACKGGLAKVIMTHTKDSFVSHFDNADSLIFNTSDYFKYVNLNYSPRFGDRSIIAITHPKLITLLLGKPVGPPPQPEITDVTVDTLWNPENQTAEVKMSFELETYPSFEVEYQAYELNSDSVFFGNLPPQTTETSELKRTVVITTSGKPPLEYHIKFRTFDPLVNLYSDWTKEDTIIIEPPPPLPSSYRLYQNYPNPFNSETTIEYDLPKKADVELIVFNILGQKVKTLVNKTEKAGTHKVVWDGKDKFGRKAGSSFYFYYLKAGKFIETKRMLLIR